jgi:hypothetical protein
MSSHVKLLLEKDLERFLYSMYALSPEELRECKRLDIKVKEEILEV